MRKKGCSNWNCQASLILAAFRYIIPCFSMLLISINIRLNENLPIYEQDMIQWMTAQLAKQEGSNRAVNEQNKQEMRSLRDILPGPSLSHGNNPTRSSPSQLRGGALVGNKESLPAAEPINSHSPAELQKTGFVLLLPFCLRAQLTQCWCRVSREAQSGRLGSEARVDTSFPLWNAANPGMLCCILDHSLIAVHMYQHGCDVKLGWYSG